MAAANSRETCWDQVLNPADHWQDYTLTGSAIPGSGALMAAHHRELHMTVTLCLTLATMFSRLVKECLTPVLASLSDRARVQIDHAEVSYRALPKIGHLTSAMYSVVLTLGNREELRNCRVSHQEVPWKDDPMRQLCCPAVLMFLVWIRSPIGDPILDFFAFALGNTAFVEAWLDCPTHMWAHTCNTPLSKRSTTAWKRCATTPIFARPPTSWLTSRTKPAPH